MRVADGPGPRPSAPDMATADTSYPVPLQREDIRRGQWDGEQRIPSLAEVRRRQLLVQENGGQLTVGYQVVLLAELGERLAGQHLRHQRLVRAAEADLAPRDPDIVHAVTAAERARERRR